MPGEDCRTIELPEQMFCGPGGVITGFAKFVTVIKAGMEPEIGPHKIVFAASVTGNTPAEL